MRFAMRVTSGGRGCYATPKETADSEDLPGHAATRCRAREGEGWRAYPSSYVCSHLAMRGAPARAIQELAGHRTLRNEHERAERSEAWSRAENAIRRMAFEA